MSAIQLLEKLGANASFRHSKNELLSEQEIKNLIDICPDVYCIMAPAEEEEGDDDDDGDGDDGDDGDKGNKDDKQSETKSIVNF